MLRHLGVRLRYVTCILALSLLFPAYKAQAFWSSAKELKPGQVYSFKGKFFAGRIQETSVTCLKPNENLKWVAGCGHTKFCKALIPGQSAKVANREFKCKQ